MGSLWYEGVQWERRLAGPEGQQRVVRGVDGGEEGPHAVDLGNVAGRSTQDEGDEGVIEAELDGPLEGGGNTAIYPGEGVCYGRHCLIDVAVEVRMQRGERQGTRCSRSPPGSFEGQEVQEKGIYGRLS